MHRCLAPCPNSIQYPSAPRSSQFLGHPFLQVDSTTFTVTQQAALHVTACKPSPALGPRPLKYNGTGTDHLGVQNPETKQVLPLELGARPQLCTTAPPAPGLSRRRKPPKRSLASGPVDAGGRIQTPLIRRLVKPS